MSAQMSDPEVDIAASTLALRDRLNRDLVADQRTQRDGGGRNVLSWTLVTVRRLEIDEDLRVRCAVTTQPRCHEQRSSCRTPMPSSLRRVVCDSHSPSSASVGCSDMPPNSGNDR
jgi:hypothetical protein